eukprot:2495882-Amphidinium_carterae.1
MENVYVAVTNARVVLTTCTCHCGLQTTLRALNCQVHTTAQQRRLRRCPVQWALFPAQQSSDGVSRAQQAPLSSGPPLTGAGQQL